MNVRVRPRVKLWEKSKTDEAIGMQRGNFQKAELGTCQALPGEVGGSRKAKEFRRTDRCNGHDLNVTAEFLPAKRKAS